MLLTPLSHQASEIRFDETGIVVPQQGQNPILKMPAVLVSGDQGTDYIDELPLAAVLDVRGGAGGEA